MSLLTDTEVIEIITRTTTSEQEEKEVIRRYIFDKKRIEVPTIADMRSHGDIFQLMEAYNTALGYFTNKLIHKIDDSLHRETGTI